MVSSVADAALTLEVLCGHDIHDSTSSQKKVPQFSKHLQGDLKGLKIGLMKEYENDGLSFETQKTLNLAAEALKQQGAEVVSISVPMVSYAIPIYYLIATSEASSNLARYDGVRFGHRAKIKELASLELDKFFMRNRGEGFGKEVQRRIMIGTYALSSGYFDAYYNKACQVRRLMTDQYLKAFSGCNVILSPITAAPAFKIGERISDPLAMYLNDIFTTSTNLAGLPGMSVPFGESQLGLPIGMQLTASHFDEVTLLKVGAALERASSVRGKVPNV
jgi:aspartyl-tRNA(Asn)/glutamyl-tRNA(Gln) amidotransferase subunit A